MYRVNQWTENRGSTLAFKIFDTLEEAEAFVKENTGHPGGPVYEIDPEDLPDEQ